jgi:transcriptional regulator with GAF, ATPase, and Fis domain
VEELEIYRRALRAVSEANLDGTLRATLDAMVEATGADRGFVVARASAATGADRGFVVARASAAGGDGAAAAGVLGDGLLVLARTVARPGAFPEAGPSEAIVRRAIESRAPVRIENALEEKEFRGRPSVLAISVLSVLAVPILSDGDALAAVYLDSARVAGIFSPESEAAAARLAAAVAPGIRTAVRLKEAEERERRLREEIIAAEGGRPPEILGRSPAFQAAIERALKAAPSDAPVLLAGESGTGKELFARAIHQASRRAKRPFVAMNCGALPEGTLEAELFGYLRGAFTGATQDRAGRFEAAHEGTILLDEVGDMPPLLQVKLLRVLQSGEIQKLGETRERRVDVRVVAATHRDLRALVREGKFREDLYFRLRVVGVEIPPLRERGDDVLLLAEAFAQRFGRAQGKEIAGLSAPAREAILRHAWPGNVRELENAVRHAVVFASGPRIAAADLPPEIAAAAPASEGGAAEGLALLDGQVPRDGEELKRAKEAAGARIERAFIRALLERAGGNVSLAARLAGMNRTVLHEIMARHGASAQDFRRAGGN